MSGGTPVGDRRYMRQRYGQGSGSGSDDIKDDASSRLNPFSQVMIPRTRTWVRFFSLSIMVIGNPISYTSCGMTSELEDMSFCLVVHMTDDSIMFNVCISIFNFLWAEVPK
ncbi:hypothetical protein ACFE04_009801 [Oxalis oulophora]